MDQALRRARFLSPTKERRPIYYFDLPAPDGTPFENVVRDAVKRARKAGFGTLIPQLPDGTELDEGKLNTVKEMYAFLLSEAKAQDLFVGFYLDPAFEHLAIRTLGEAGDNSLRAKILDCKEYVCARGEAVDRPVARGILLSVVAYCEEYAETVDLRPFIKDGRILWQAPSANFVLRQYVLVEEKGAGINVLIGRLQKSERIFLDELNYVYDWDNESFVPFEWADEHTLTVDGRRVEVKR